MVIAGGYLVYLGVKLMMDIVNDKINSSPLIMICAIFFMAAGALAVIFYVRLMLKQNKADAEANEDAEEENEDTEEIEAAENNQEEDSGEAEEKEASPETTVEDETKIGE